MKIPVYRNDIPLSGGDIRTVRGSTEVNDSIADAGAAIARVAGERSLQQRKTKQVADLTKAQADILTAITEKEVATKSNADNHQNWAAEFSKSAKESVDELLASYDDPDVSSVARNYATSLISKTQASLIESGVSVGRDRARATAYTALEDLKGVAIKSPARFADIERTVDATLAGLVADGSIGAESSVKVKDIWKQDVWGAIAERDILNNPWDALKKIHAGAYGIAESDKTKFIKAANARAQQLQSQYKEQQSIQAGVDYVDAALVAGIPLDYGNADHRKAVDAYYKMTLAPSLANSEDAPAALAEFIGKVGMVPATLQSHIRSRLISGDAQSVAAVADLVDRIDNINPVILQDTVKKKDIAFAKMVNQRINAGIDPLQAVEEAKKLRDMPQEVEKSLKATYQKEKYVAKNDDFLENADFVDKGWFSSAATVPRTMQAEFDRMVEDNFVMTGGDIDTARTMTANALRRKWAITEIGGEKRMMRFAPEAVYKPLDSDTDWIKEQFEDATKGLSGASLESDFRTEREGMPSYLVTLNGVPYFTEGEVKAPLFKYGLSVRYRPKYEMTNRFAERQKAIGEYQAAAKKKHDQIKTMRSLLKLEHDLAGAIEQVNDQQP